MSDDNEDYWYNQWHLDTNLHKEMFIKDVEQIPEGTVVSVYGDTDSIFVGFEPAIKHCQWKNNVFNEGWLNRCPHPYRIIREEELEIEINNPNYKGTILFDDHDMSIDGNVIEELPDDFKILIIDGSLLKNYRLNDLIKDYKGKIVHNWAHEIEFIHGLDKYRIAGFFEDQLTEHAESYGVEN